MKERAWQLLESFLSFIQVLTPIYLAWVLWGTQVKEMLTVVRSATANDLVWAATVCAVMAVCLHHIGKKYPQTRQNAYWLYFTKFRGWSNERAHKFNYFNSNVPERFILLSRSSHPVAAWIEWWLERLFIVLFWPTTILGCAKPLYEGGRSPLWAAVLSMGAVLVLALLTMRLGNLVAAALLMMWLGIVYYSQGLQQTLVQAVLVGSGMALWGLWQRWRAKIHEASAAQAPPSPEEPA